MSIVLQPEKKERLAAPHHGDTPAASSDTVFERIARVAACLFDAPIGLVAFYDEDACWRHSGYGWNPQEPGSEAFFHALASLEDEIFLVPDASLDPRFAGHRYVSDEPGIRFCAGAHLQAPDGTRTGTLCAIDTRPRDGADDERTSALRELAALAEAELERRLLAARRPNTETPPLESGKILSSPHDATTIALCVLDEQGDFVEANRSCAGLFGYDPEELTGQPFTALLSPDLAAGEVERFRAAFLPHVATTSGEWRAQRKDGSPLDIYVSTHPLPARGGRHFTVATILDITERKRAEAALRESEQRYRSVIETSPNAIILCGLDGTILFCNQPATHLYGFRSVEKAIGANIFDLVAPEDRERARQNAQRALDWGSVRDVEYTLLRQDGARFPAEIRSAPILGTDGKPSAFTSVVTDISDRKRAEALRASAERYALAARGANDGLWDWNLKTNEIYFSTRWKSMLGYEENEIGTSPEEWFSRVHPEDVEQVKAQIAAHVEGSIPHFENEHRILRKDGTYRWVLSRGLAVRDAAGKSYRMAGSQLDITERRQAEEAQRASEAELRALFAAINDVILVLDANGRYLKVAPTNASLLYRPASELLGHTLHDVFPTAIADTFLGYIRQALEKGQTVRCEYSLPLDGGETWFAATVSPMGEGAVIWVARDITERKRAQALEEDRRRVLEMIAKNQPLELVLYELALLVERQRPEMRCAVFLLENGQISRGIAPNLPDGLAQPYDWPSYSPPTGSAPKPPDAVVVADIATDPAWKQHREAAARHNLRVSWSVPIVSATGQLLGTFAAYSRASHRPKSRDVELLEMASRLAAIAVEHRQLTDQLAYQAQHDALTGLPNRILFEDRLRQALAQAQRHGKMVAVLFLDLDRFKQINDTLGHHIGDLLLEKVARRLESCVRQSDTVVRMGGDEFTLVLPDLSDLQGAVAVAKKLLNALKAPFEVEGHELFVSASIGISVFPEDGQDVATLHRNADSAMYRAKSRGRNTFQCFAPEMNAAALERLELENHLRRAIERGELELYYQPQVEISGKLLGFEALLRWNHPRLGVISPDRFIPLAEESGLIIQIGRWVLREACRQLKTWRRSGFPALRVAVNVSAVQFSQPDFVETVMLALAQSGLEPDLLELELTESMLMRDYRDVAPKLTRLRTLGVGIAVDDFGTGYSSLAYLQQLPIDTLKIDRSFVRNIGTQSQYVQNQGAIVRAITMLAHSLGMSVVAEGVETEQQLDFLGRIGYDGLQGYLFSAPLPASQFEGLLKGRVKLYGGGSGPEGPRAL